MRNLILLALCALLTWIPATVFAGEPKEVTPERDAGLKSNESTPWTLTTPIGDVVADRPATARVFELVGIDYCCGGKQSLADAAKTKKLDPQVLLSALLVVGANDATAATKSWVREPLPDVLAHIETTHHAYLRRELPRLSKIVATVTRVHGAQHPELAELKAIYDVLAKDLPVHLNDEEQRVFPAIRRAVNGVGTKDLVEMISALQKEHDDAGAAFHRIRELTRGFVVPDGACRLYKEMLTGLTALERDTHTHVHLENSVVLPRALELAKKPAASR